MNETGGIYGGAFQIARKIFASEIWLDKPASWKVIWIYILGKVNHAPTGIYERGEGYFNFSQEKKNIGVDITSDMIKKFLQYGRQNEMLRTTRSTRGVRIKVLNYDKYQDLSNFSSTTRSTREAREKHERSTPINKNDKNVKNDKNINSSEPSGSQEEVNKIMAIFQNGNNPTINYGNKTQRKAVEYLVGKFGLEKTTRLAEYAVFVSGEPFAPVITTPYQLKEQMGKLIAYYNRNSKGQIAVIS